MPNEETEETCPPTPPPPPLAQLTAAIAAITMAVGTVKETGKNDHDGYTYASDADLKRALAPLLGQHGIAMLPTRLETRWDEVKTHGGSTHFRCRMRMTMLVCHTSGESIELIGLGEGINSRDKALYIAQTGAHKYLLRTLFCIPTGDDAERDEDLRKRKHEQELDEAANTWPTGKNKFDASMRGALGLDKKFDILSVYDWAHAELKRHIGDFTDVQRNRMLDWLTEDETKEKWATWLLDQVPAVAE